MIPGAHLRRLRNEVPFDRALDELGIPNKNSEDYRRFLCPACREFNTAVNPRTNLGRCFRCQRNYNVIELFMVADHLPFLEAVTCVERMLRVH